MALEIKGRDFALYNRWETALPKEARAAPDWRKRDRFRDLIARYGEEQRAYHTLDHIAWCLEMYDSAAHLIGDSGEVVLALFYHDVIYDPDRKDNEERSAAWAHSHLNFLGTGWQFTGRVCSYILATRHTGEAIADEWARYVVDIDLSSLGARYDVFQRNSAKIGVEYLYGGISSEAYAIGRARFFEAMLKRERIFYTKEFWNRFERHARKNIQKSLAKLNE